MLLEIWTYLANSVPKVDIHLRRALVLVEPSAAMISGRRYTPLIKALWLRESTLQLCQAMKPGAFPWLSYLVRHTALHAVCGGLWRGVRGDGLTVKFSDS